MSPRGGALEAIAGNQLLSFDANHSLSHHTLRRGSAVRCGRLLHQHLGGNFQAAMQCPDHVEAEGALPRRAVTVLRGDLSRQKILRFNGLTFADLKARLKL